MTLRKMGISALLLVGGALLDFLANNLVEFISGVGVPIEYRPVTVSVCTWLVASAREFIKGKSYDAEMQGR